MPIFLQSILVWGVIIGFIFVGLNYLATNLEERDI